MQNLSNITPLLTQLTNKNRLNTPRFNKKEQDLYIQDLKIKERNKNDWE